jgi:hypothetical protein
MEDSKIIYRGVVQDNVDPKGLGRVRVYPNDWIIADHKYVSDFDEKTDAWSSPKDPFLFKPLIPNNLSFIPQVGDAVNIIYTDTSRQFIDGYYIPISVGNWSQFGHESAENQLSNTRDGLNYVGGPTLIKENGEYVKKKYDGAFPKFDDKTITTFNSDVIFKDNAIVIRSGKLHEDASKKQGEPIRDENPGIFQIGKYDSRSKIVEKEPIETYEKEHSHVEVLFEYNIDNIDNQGFFSATVFVYKLAKKEGFTETTDFNQITDITNDERKLIISKEVTGDSLEDLAFNIRHTIKQIIKSGARGLFGLDGFIKHTSSINPTQLTSIYPFYFRPTPAQFDGLISNPKFKSTIDLIHIKSRRGYGLIYSDEYDDTPERLVTTPVFERETETISNKRSVLITDTNYFISYDNNIPVDERGIDFSKVSNYEIDENQLSEVIEPHTYALVRGEKLQELLDTIYLFMVTHVHNPAEPAVVNPAVKDDLERKFRDFKQNILSKNNRIN